MVLQCNLLKDVGQNSPKVVLEPDVACFYHKTFDQNLDYDYEEQVINDLQREDLEVDIIWLLSRI